MFHDEIFEAALADETLQVPLERAILVGHVTHTIIKGAILLCSIPGRITLDW